MQENDEIWVYNRELCRGSIKGCGIYAFDRNDKETDNDRDAKGYPVYDGHYRYKAEGTCGELCCREGWRG